MNNGYVRVAVFGLLGMTGVSFAIGALLPARAGNSVAPQPLVTPTVCTTRGVCFEVENNGYGTAIQGNVTRTNAKGIVAQATNTSQPQIALEADAFGPSSFAILARSFSTDATHASAAIRGQSANGRGISGIT